MDSNKITLTIPDLIVGIQETMLVTRHGRMDESSGGHGELRRELYRYMSHSLEGNELSFDIFLRRGDLDVVLRLRRLYHHEGYVYRICYVTDGAKAVFAKGVAKGTDIAITQLGAWAAAKYFSTPPKGCRIIYHRVSENPNDPEPVKESKLFTFELLDDDTMHDFVDKRIELIQQNIRTPDQNLPECSLEERFALKTDNYCKCRSACRARDYCHQYAVVREQGTKDFEEAKGVLANLVGAKSA